MEDSTTEGIDQTIDFLSKRSSLSQGEKKKYFETVKEFFIKNKDLITEDELYEKYYRMTFQEYWNEFLFNEGFEKYKKDLFDRYEKSTDKETFYKIEVDKLEIKDLLASQKREEGIDLNKIGYLIAVNGNNPVVFDLVNNVTEYQFDEIKYNFAPQPISDALHDIEFSVGKIDNIINSLPELDKMLQSKRKIRSKHFSELMQVCWGYLRAKKVQFLKEFEKDTNEKNESLPETIQICNQKLKWNGTPSQFGFIIDLLIQGGYLEKPTSSFAKDANFYLQFFDIETTNTTLAKELSEGTNSLATKNRNKINIPHIHKLD